MAQSAAGRHGERDRRRAGNIAGSRRSARPRPRRGRRLGKNAASANVAIIEMLRKIDAAAALAKRCMHVEHAAIKRHQRDQQQIGKGDPGQLDRERGAARARR